MVRHRWELRGDTAGPVVPARRLRLRVGRGATLCLLLGALAWICVSLLFHPASGAGQPLGEVELVPSAATETAGQAGTAKEEGTAGNAQPSEGAPGSDVAGGAQDPAGDTAPGAAAEVVVHVAGAVKKPGVYTFPAGTRANTAVRKAGGLTHRADQSAINLASPLIDGQQLLIPSRGPRPPAGSAEPPAGGAGLPSDGGPGAGAAGPVNVNTASAAELEELPGVGPAMSAKIIDFRERNGPISSLAELDAVPGIGPAMMARLDGLVGFG